MTKKKKKKKKPAPKTSVIGSHCFVKVSAFGDSDGVALYTTPEDAYKNGTLNEEFYELQVTGLVKLVHEFDLVAE